MKNFSSNLICIKARIVSLENKLKRSDDSAYNESVQQLQQLLVQSEGKLEAMTKALNELQAQTCVQLTVQKEVHARFIKFTPKNKKKGKEYDCCYHNSNYYCSC